MQLLSRTQKILNAIVEDYIQSAKPVSSRQIALKFAISPATVRNEMMKLEKQHLITQPYTSAGRVPTDEAYHFYISCLHKELLAEKVRNLLAKKLRSIPDYEGLVRGATRMLAEISGNIAISRPSAQRGIYYAGLANALKQPESLDLDFTTAIGEIIDYINDNAGALAATCIDDSTEIYIGRQNPFYTYDSCSLLLSGYENPLGEQCFVGVLGPKRMNYQRIIPVIKYISKVLEEVG